LQGGAGTPGARWTGVYGPVIAPDYDQTPSTVATSLTDTSRVDINTGSQARLLTWLVSGNEHDAFNPATQVGGSGEITATAATLLAGIDFRPSAVDGLSTTATIDTALTIRDRDDVAHPAALLVGSSTTQSAVSGIQAIDYVAAPLINIDVPGATIPGQSGGTPVSIGRYAWWIGDEGLKSRADLPLTTVTADKPAAFTVAARDAIELMDANSLSYSATPPALNATRVGSAYDPAAGVGRAMTASQLPSASPTPAAFTDILRRRYHDLGVNSRGLLTDTYRGGLRRDLTSLLTSGYTPPSGDPTLDDNPLHPLDALPGAHAEEKAGYAVPTWAHLRDHYQTVVPTSGADSGYLVPQLPVHDQAGQPGRVGVSPVITYAALGTRFAVVGGQVQFNLYPVVVLWNPYTVPMRGVTYEVGYLYSLEGRCIQFQVRDPSLPDTYDNWQVRETRDMAYGGLLLDASPPLRDRDAGGIERFVRFRITATDLAAGESRVFTLAANTTYGSSVTDLNPCPDLLQPGLNSTAHASMAGTVLSSTELNWDYRVVTSANYMKAVPGRLRFDGAKFAAAADQSGIGGTGSGTTTNGVISVYLGSPRTTPVNPASREQLWNSSINNWYQTIQGGYHENNLVGNPLQGPEELTEAIPDDEPSLSTFVLNIFSASGNNGISTLGNIPRHRWLVHGNPRARDQFQTRRDATFATNHIGRVSNRAEMWPTWFATNSPGDRASSGLTHDMTAGSLPVDATLFEVRSDSDPLYSIGHLQHANLSLVGSSPAWPVGNANADFRLPDPSAISSSTAVSSIGRPGLSRAQAVYYDNSWLLNRALWDRYFFSTIPASGYSPGTALPNPRLRVFDDTAGLNDPSTAAAGLLVEGAFNVNSTSEQAWRAVLGGVNQLAYNPATRDDGAALGAAFSRFLKPENNSTVPAAGGSPADLWRGYRILSADEIAQLARNIVAEIRARGPFISLGDFVNRRLVNNPATAEDERLKGTLQAAIDATYVTGSGSYAANNTTGTLWPSFTRYANPPSSGYYTFAARGTAITNSSSNPLSATDNAAFRRLPAFAPKFLTQGDVLSSLGSRLSARSDTFTIRTYGETLNPATGQRDGRAWCEAVVQRIPDYVDPNDTASVNPPTFPNNQRFGRRFVVVSFRWLSPADL
ncbi:MAG: hypothetical protein ABW223_05475, partial [Rariglobus sp.]